MHIVSGINALLCGIIWVVGLIVYRKSKIKASFYIGIAFGLFGISHLLSAVVFPGSLVVILTARLVAYAMVGVSLCKLACTCK
ncbi:hypothetical protein BU251_06460 [Candidatus Velamenicoccus archaeovorus]|uniref:Uncharacterized protein n=1 Tax=Velamenicoccus archaeovorus TaxID=1930593 RepID=A0A410P5I2_VELA1|nr:hypothetical protein [Candidatus Velamenicoccus archaeovorus]QAT17390.1 hypothetical protein BU251_06460 [Candidatus Velamenicoccus archaeovorus]